MYTNQYVYETKNRRTDIEGRLVDAKGKEGLGREGLGVWD